ncbi:MAG TPA: DMT family transporter [Burkholderiaceae bacterium]|nr:DMT family transporter [Burkholderiaceae bacterium]
MLLMPPLCWAGNAVVARALVGQFPPLALSCLRWVLAFAFLLPFAWHQWHAQRHALKGHTWMIGLMSLLGVGVYNSFQYLALQTSPVLNVTLIAASAPVFVLLTGALFFGERIYMRQLLGAAVSICGVLAVLLRGQWTQLLELRIAAGDAWMLAAAASWAVYTWLIRRHRPAMDGVPFLAMQMAIGSALIAPFALWEGASGASVVWSSSALWGLLFVATFPSLVAYWCWDIGVARAGAVVPRARLSNSIKRKKAAAAKVELNI